MAMLRTIAAVAFLGALLSGGRAWASQSPGAPATDLTPLYAPGTWLNGTATAATLRGKVVLVDVFTFDCINCQHVVPNLRQLNAREPASRFAIVGVHAPETAFERVQSNVTQNLAAQGITWPVRIDNDFTVWQAYGIQYWPTQLIFDRHGRLRQTIIGEGRDDEVNAVIQNLLAQR
jgi:thiol-disulfide isomerase/thioredoxin